MEDDSHMQRDLTHATDCVKITITAEYADGITVTLTADEPITAGITFPGRHNYRNFDDSLPSDVAGEPLEVHVEPSLRHPIAIDLGRNDEVKSLMSGFAASRQNMRPWAARGKPVLTEQASDNSGSYEQQWYCQPPAPGVTYMVTDCAWTPDHRVRAIFAVQLGHGGQKRT